MVGKKKIYLYLGSLLVVLFLGIIFYFQHKKNMFEEANEPSNFQQEDNKIWNDSRYLVKEENGIIKDKKNGYIIYNPLDSYTKLSLDEVEVKELLEDNAKLYEYLKYFFWAFYEQSYDSFSEKEIALVVSLALSTYGVNDSDYVEKIAKRYFGMEHYELPTGTYIIPNYGNYSILKEGEYYIRSSVEESSSFTLENNTLELKEIKKEENTYTIYYDYFKGSAMMGLCYFETSTQEEKEECRLGEHILELNYHPNDDTLFVTKIKYIKK